MNRTEPTIPADIDVDTLIDGQKVGRSSIVLLIVGALAMIADGYDLAVMGFIAPELVKSWHVAPAALVPAFSAGVFGLLLGAPVLGFIGDRFGRRTAMVVVLALVGGFTLLTMAATSLDQFVVLRFLTGIGLGGLIPNVIALTAEAAPKRIRGVFIIAVNFGVPAGIALPGLVAALLVPQYGWTVLLLVGGVLPLLVALCVHLFLQESLRYLVGRGGREEDVRRLAQGLRPDLDLGGEVRVVARTASPRNGRMASPAKLFKGGLAIVTPMLWIMNAGNQFANFFAISWLPTLLQANGATTAEAGINASMFSVGGIIGGIVLMFIIDRLGALPLLVLFALGGPVIATIGYAHVAPILLGVIIAGAGFCVTGNNIGMSALLGMVYPTPVRSLGVGATQAFGRVGAIAAQFAGGALLAAHLPMDEVFLTPATSMVLAAVACGCLVVSGLRTFGSFRLHEAEPAAPPAVPGLGKLPA